MGRYYTPEAEEFHIGFEYEALWGLEGIDEEWLKEVFGEGQSWETTERTVRVKYLDREDIESCGFKIYGKGEKTFHIKTNTNYMLHLLDNILITKEIKLPNGQPLIKTFLMAKLKISPN